MDQNIFICLAILALIIGTLVLVFVPTAPKKSEMLKIIDTKTVGNTANSSCTSCGCK